LLTHNNHIALLAAAGMGRPLGQRATSMEFVMHTRCGARACDYVTTTTTAAYSWRIYFRRRMHTGIFMQAAAL
jgi:hypothetical protein